MITALVCLMITVFVLIGISIGMDEHAKRVELEEEVWRLRWEHACRKHPALRNGGPQWWQDMSL